MAYFFEPPCILYYAILYYRPTTATFIVLSVVNVTLSKNLTSFGRGSARRPTRTSLGAGVRQ